jgi:hypothetical protein
MADGLASLEQEGRILANSQLEKETSSSSSSGKKDKSIVSNAADFAGDVWDSMSLLDRAALLSSPVPVVGDVIGGIADLSALIKDPSLTNAGILAAGLVPFVPSGSVTRTAQKAFTNLRNDIPGFYATTDPLSKIISAIKTVPEGIGNVLQARYLPEQRAIQEQFNISVADQKAARNAIDLATNIPDEMKILEKELKEMKELGSKPGGAYTGKLTEKNNKQKTEIFREKEDKLKKEKSIIRQASKKAMGQLNQSLSFTKQLGGIDTELKGLLKNIEGVDNIKTFEKFNVDEYFDEVGDVSGLDKKDISGMFEQIKKVQGMDLSKPYQMNIRRVYTGSAGNLDPTTKNKVYKSVPEDYDVFQEGLVKQLAVKKDISLDDIKKDVFPELKKTKKGLGSRKTYTSDKEFLDALDEAGVAVRNRDDVLKGRAAIIKGSGKSDAWELGGVNYITAITKDAKAVTIVNDEHDLFSFKLPGGDRYMNVSEPIFYDLKVSENRTKKLTKKQSAAEERLAVSKKVAVKNAIDNYTNILKNLNIEIPEKTPAAFSSREQYLRALVVANLKPDKKDYSRLKKEASIGFGVRAGKSLLSPEEQQEEPTVQNKKKGGSVVERNPYNYTAKAI